ncbi:importin-13 [Dendroctonus ponderosae]|uniref:Importin-13 n=1 Tax=Dendroctonus ponderosae TaxID=77166 RepID=A0AAR5PPN3_DENPD|nr:importin-13 [Dendroctonus ponderosae]KAH1009274.1 hypothetical protein HUJ04_001652 [Dendroctonus ponderosae]KAH1017249.1 hypothetical protein HUJ05_007922 [Dendroctonus ponderosae]
MSFTVQNLEEAVAIFYRSEANQQAEAHEWLNKAQNSPQAWSFVWELLDPQRNFQVQFYGATTLHAKLMKYWHEVPESHYESLKKRLFEAIISYAMGPKIILNRLCITLSAYIIHTIPTHWPNAFEELVSSFQPHNLPTIESERVIWILLEILTVIPEEFQTTTLCIGRRNKVKIELQKVSNDILKVLEICLMPIPDKGFDMMNLTTYLTAARCACSWMHLGGLNLPECESICNLLIDLTCYVYWNKIDPECLSAEEMELSEVALEALTAIAQHPNTAKYEHHLTKFAANVMYKFEKIFEAEMRCNDLNKDIISNLYGLIAVIGDSHTKVFIDNLKSANQEEQQISFDLFNSILKCTNLPGLYPVDETSSTLTFAFWYTLQEEILARGTSECAQLLLMAKPYYRDLVCILLRKSMFPLLDDTSWTLDDKEVFRCYRQDVSDTYMYCYNALNLEMLDILTTKLNEVLNKENGNAFGQVKWNEIETCLHAFCAIAESIEMENLYLPKLMMTIKDIPFNDLHVKVLNTALDTVGAYSEWLTDHPDLLGNVLPLVISALGNSEVTINATLALKDLTYSCQKFLLPYVDHILMAAQIVIQNGSFKLGDCKRLMYSIGRVLSIMPVDRVMDYLNVTLAPTFEDIQKLILQPPSSSMATSLATRLKILAALFNSLYVQSEDRLEQQPIFLIMKNTMSYYKKIAEMYSDNSEVILDLSTLLKYVVTTLKDHCKPLIKDILQIVVTIYRAKPQAHILVVAKTVVILFGKEPDLCHLSQQLIQEICNQTLLICFEKNNQNQLSEIADLLEGFFSLLFNIIKKVPHLIFNNEMDTAALFECAILCLVLPEVQTLKAISSFLVHFITQSRDVSQVIVVQAYGESLVLRILLNLGSTAPRSSIDHLSDIILVLNKKYCDSLSRWLNTLLVQENFPTPRITAQQKEIFIKLVLREKANKRKLCDSVLEFALICRGIMKPDNTLP